MIFYAHTFRPTFTRKKFKHTLVKLPHSPCKLQTQRGHAHILHTHTQIWKIPFTVMLRDWTSLAQCSLPLSPRPMVMLHEICDAVGRCIWKACAQISRSCTPLGPAVDAVAIKAEVNGSAVGCMPKHRDRLAITLCCDDRPIYLVIRTC